MGTPGAQVILASGKRGILPSGKRALYDANGECPECCESDICTDPGYATIQIADYADGDIGGCEDCAEPDPFLPGTWNGVFERATGTIPTFEWNQSGCSGDEPECWWGACEVGEIDGKAFSDAVVFYCADSGVWHLIVSCVEGTSFQPMVLWKGEKSGGDTPEGTYSRTEGCNAGPSSLEIIAGGSCPE
jgi:hypothetical protein